MFQKSLQESQHLKTAEAIQPGERILCVVMQHPFGIIFIDIITIICLLFSLVAIIMLLPDMVARSSDKIYFIMALLIVTIVSVVGLILLVSTAVYRRTKLTITDRNIIQILQSGIFVQKISQISLANVEDVTSEQKGIFPGMFNFGVLQIETAGEQHNFSFPFCPNPHRVAKIILDAKQHFLEVTGMAGSYRNNIYTNSFSSHNHNSTERDYF